MGEGGTIVVWHCVLSGSIGDGPLDVAWNMWNRCRAYAGGRGLQAGVFLSQKTSAVCGGSVCRCVCADGI